jgi:hypothetical protein
MTAAARQQLSAAAPANTDVTVHDFVPNAEKLLAGAAAVVLTAGYSSACKVLIANEGLSAGCLSVLQAASRLPTLSRCVGMTAAGLGPMSRARNKLYDERRLAFALPIHAGDRVLVLGSMQAGSVLGEPADRRPGFLGSPAVHSERYRGQSRQLSSEVGAPPEAGGGLTFARGQTGCYRFSSGGVRIHSRVGGE